MSEITSSAEFRELERLREAQTLYHAKRERDLEIALALQMRMVIADIAKLTGLTREEVERLRTET